MRDFEAQGEGSRTSGKPEVCYCATMLRGRYEVVAVKQMGDVVSRVMSN